MNIKADGHLAQKASSHEVHFAFYGWHKAERLPKFLTVGHEGRFDSLTNVSLMVMRGAGVLESQLLMSCIAPADGMNGESCTTLVFVPEVK